MVIVHDQPGDRALDDADAAGDELLPVVCGERVGVREEDDVGRPLAHQQGMLDAFEGEHANFAGAGLAFRRSLELSLKGHPPSIAPHPGWARRRPRCRAGQG